MLQKKLEILPPKPGVYLFKDSKGKVIYIGKAKSLRHRVRSYFQASRHADPKTEVLKEHIRDLDYIVTDNELEALLLESNMVKKNKPRFNVNLKDDKAFLHIKLTIDEPFPRVLLTRRVVDDGALYFGPFLPASLARNTIKIINRHFLLRTCDLAIDGKLDRPCLEYYIKRCMGPCVSGLCSQQEYTQAAKDVCLFLEGKNQELIRSLKAKMIEASEKQHFEAAAVFRDRIRMVRDLTEKQKVIQEGSDDVDVFAYWREGRHLALQLFTLRRGRVVGKREFYWEKLDFFEPAIFMRSALQQYYLTAGFIPHQIYLPREIEDMKLMGQWLSEKLVKAGKGRQVRILVPQRGHKRQLVQLVERNAQIAFQTRFRLLKSEKDKLLEELQRELDLPELPHRIEAFDVSNIQGAEPVASLVVSEGGVMKKSQYRKFKVNTVQGPDDFLALYEVVYRRYHRLLEEGGSLPDLILIDGGKGQLHSAYQALSKLGVEGAPLASIAKREEIIYVQGRDEPVELSRSSPVLHLIQQIRDEAHRFAVTYHRKRRSLRDFDSELDQIPGVGANRKKLLLRSFGSLERIRSASVEELSPIVGTKLARTIKSCLHSP